MPGMRSDIVIFIIVFALLGLLLGFSESYDFEPAQPQLVGAYTHPAIYPSVTATPPDTNAAEEPTMKDADDEPIFPAFFKQSSDGNQTTNEVGVTYEAGDGRLYFFAGIHDQ